MTRDHILKLDPLIHAPVRLAVLSILADVDRADFVFLREATRTTDGNLSTHLGKLEDAGYITVTKRFVEKKPRTTCAMTRKGRRAFVRYLEQLEQIVEGRKQRQEE
jgi:DNA-binding PadR family transcriptional regulator